MAAIWTDKLNNKKNLIIKDKIHAKYNNTIPHRVLSDLEKTF